MNKTKTTLITNKISITIAFCRRRRRVTVLAMVLNIREFTHVRRRRQVDCYQYNDINPLAQKKYIIKRFA